MGSSAIGQIGKTAFTTEFLTVASTLFLNIFWPWKILSTFQNLRKMYCHNFDCNTFAFSVGGFMHLAMSTDKHYNTLRYYYSMDEARATQNHPERARVTQSQLEPSKNHPEPTRASQSQPVANKNLYFVLPLLLEHSYLFLWTNYI